MMREVSQRKKMPNPGDSEDEHARIAAEASALRAKGSMEFQAAEKSPGLSALIDSANDALSKAVPATFVHLGRTYYLRVSIGLARLMVFETATAPKPLTIAIVGSFDEVGRQPNH